MKSFLRLLLLPVRARTCVAVRAKKKKNFQSACQKQQPHRPFLRSRKRRLDWGIVFIYKRAKEIKKLLEYSKSSLSGSSACPYGMFTCIPRIIAFIEVTTAVILTHTELIKIQIKIKFTSLSLLAMTFAAIDHCHSYATVRRQGRICRRPESTVSLGIPCSNCFSLKIV